jgi:hypothetical protein
MLTLNVEFTVVMPSVARTANVSVMAAPAGSALIAATLGA